MSAQVSFVLSFGIEAQAFLLTGAKTQPALNNYLYRK
jgi:hypothetical protein